MSINVRKRSPNDTGLSKKGVPAKTFCSRIGGQLSLILTTSEKQSTVTSEVLPQEKVNDLITNYIISEFRSLITVEKQSFKDLVTGLSPSFTVMSRPTLRKNLDSKFEIILKTNKDHIQKSVSICTTADIWSCLKRSYMGVTAHWIREDLSRISVALACKRFKGSLTFDVIAEKLFNIHSDFGLDHHNIDFTVTDNGSNFVKAFNECQDDSDFDDSENVVSLESEPQSSSDEEDTYEVEMVDVDTILTNEQEQTSSNKYITKTHETC